MAKDLQKPFTDEEARAAVAHLPGWHLADDNRSIYREFVLKNFTAAIDLINRIAKIAESDNHHPDIHLTNYRKLRVEWTTHDVGGLTDKDSDAAAKVSSLPMILKHS